MKLIGAGFGRTGTASLQTALHELGFDPCYHMSEVMKKPNHALVWQAALDHKKSGGEAVDWRSTFLDQYAATVDWPGCFFYQELMAAYPEAKVLLSVRDPERWYESTHETIYQMLDAMPGWLTAIVPPVRKMHNMVTELVWNTQLEGRFAEKERAIEIFNEWTDEVKRTVPPEKLLVFNVKEGWEPLCAFLGVPVPETEFPHVNDRAEMLGNINMLRRVGWLVPLVVLLIIAVILFFIFG